MTNSEGGESLLSKWAFVSPLSLRRSEVRVCATPGARHPVHFVAFDRIRAAAGMDPWRLLGHIVRRQNEFRFQRDLVTDMLTITDLAYEPLLLSHRAPPNYAVIV